jgi:DNA-binding GntR family transcriptional regulator
VPVYAPDVEINRSGPAWPWEQVADALRELAAGLEPDQPLPSAQRLAQEYGVALKTARKALKALEAEGLVYTRPGRGTFRAGPPDSRAPRQT